MAYGYYDRESDIYWVCEDADTDGGGVEAQDVSYDAKGRLIIQQVGNKLTNTDVRVVEIKEGVYGVYIRFYKQPKWTPYSKHKSLDDADREYKNLLEKVENALTMSLSNLVKLALISDDGR